MGTHMLVRSTSAFIHTCTLARAIQRVYEDALGGETGATDVDGGSGGGGGSHIVRVLIYAAYRAFLLPRYRDLSAANYTFMRRLRVYSLFPSFSFPLAGSSDSVQQRFQPTSARNDASGFFLPLFRPVAAILSEWRMDEVLHTSAIIYFERARSIAHAILKIRKYNSRRIPR